MPVRPPYKSPWPLRTRQLKCDEEPEDGEEDPYSTIRFSVMTWDFHRYVIKPAVQKFVAPDQRRLRREFRRRHEARLQEVYEVFLCSLTDEQRTAAEALRTENETVHERFLASLSQEQRGHLDRFLSLVQKREPEEPIPFDTERASRWIFHQVLRLGWTPARFGEVDQVIRDGSRSGSRIERIGKKYQWIAFHQLLAILADHCLLHDRWSDEPVRPYSGPWEFSERDLDPSLLLRSEPRERQESLKLSWLVPAAASFEAVNSGEGSSHWLQSLDDCPSPVKLLEVTDPQKRRWIILEGNYSWEESAPPDLDPHSVDRRRLWYQLRSYLVRKRDLSRFFAWAKRQQWYGRWMPESHSFSEAFLGEYPWHPAASEAFRDWDGPSARENPVPVLVTSAEYLWSKSSEIDGSVSALVPSVPLLRDLGLHWNGNEVEYADEEGRIIAHSPMCDSPSCLLVCPDAMATYLDHQGYALVWTLVGEKLVIGPSLQAGDPDGRAEIDGVLILRSKKIEQVALHLHFVASGERRPARSSGRRGGHHGQAD